MLGLKNKKRIIDWVTILLITTYHMSLLGEFTIDLIPHTSKIHIIILLLLLHIIRFGTNYISFFRIKNNILINILIIIYLFDTIQLLFIGKGFVFVEPAIMCCITYLLTSYIYNMLEDEGRFEYLIYPYYGYSIYNILAVCVVGVLVIIGVDWHINEIDVSQVSLLKGHINWDMPHYFPFGLSVATNFHQDLFGAFPTLTGLSHEPGVMLSYITPAFIMFIGTEDINKKIKILLLILFVFVVVESASTTGILCLLFILGIELYYNALIKSNYTFIIQYVILCSIMAYYFDDYIGLLQYQIDYKISGQDESGATSEQMLKYVYEIKTFIGFGNFPPVSGLNLKYLSAGFITLVLDVVYVFVFLYKVIKLVMSRDRFIHYCGLAFTFFILFQFKMSFLVFSYDYLIYMTILVSVMSFWEEKTQNLRLYR